MASAATAAKQNLERQRSDLEAALSQGDRSAYFFYFLIAISCDILDATLVGGIISEFLRPILFIAMGKRKGFLMRAFFMAGDELILFANILPLTTLAVYLNYRQEQKDIQSARDNIERIESALRA